MTETAAPLVVINVVGLTASLLGEHSPNLNAIIADGAMNPVKDVFPAVTTTAQASMVTGKMPADHGIVGNGWYWRDLAEVKFWLQPDRLVQAPKVWERLQKGNPDFVCSRLFWWNNMYSDVSYSVTPRPHYHADGRKEIGLYSSPDDLHARLETALGPFPFFNFWGPKADISSSEWIAQAASLEFDWHRPDLQFVYLPHLDYNLQRLGPSHPAIWQDVQAIDAVVGKLADQLRSQGADILIVSEYGITQVSRCIHINQLLHEQGFLNVRKSASWELLDAGASRAFAVVDHQVAHIYIKNAADIPAVRQLLEACPGVEQVLSLSGKQEMGIDHTRAGELIAIAEPDAWFSYYYWLDANKAPDFARTVDIHRKPGYDPVELFVDPDIRFPRMKVARRLAQKSLGMRMLMDVIPLDTSLVKGSHGHLATRPEDGPLVIASQPGKLDGISSLTDVANLIYQHFRTESG